MSRAKEVSDYLDTVSSLAILCHENPDPDALSSGLALETIAHEQGVENVVLAYGGEVSHQQNRVFINILDVQVQTIRDIDFENFEAIALVDHGGRRIEESFPANRTPDIVIDHHHTSDDVHAQFVDIRPAYGSTASILVEYLQALEIDVQSVLASGLLFALHRERLDYMRSPTVHEYDAARYMFPRANPALIEQMYDSEFTPAMLDTVAAAIRHREVRGSTLVSPVGHATERDALVQAADFLLNLEGIDTVLVVGIVDGVIQMSARSIDPRVHIGDVLREAFGDIGSAGGHRDMAGAQIPLGLFADDADDETALDAFVSTRVTKRFFTVMHLDSKGD